MKKLITSFIIFSVLFIGVENQLYARGHHRHHYISEGRQNTFLAVAGVIALAHALNQPDVVVVEAPQPPPVVVSPAPVIVTQQIIETPPPPPPVIIEHHPVYVPFSSHSIIHREPRFKYHPKPVDKHPPKPGVKHREHGKNTQGIRHR